MRNLFVVLAALAMLVSCGPKKPPCRVTETPEKSCTDGKDNDCDGKTDAADPDCVNKRLSKAVWDGRQRFLLDTVHLHKGMKHQKAAKALARGEWIDVSSLEVSYWAWPVVFYAWQNNLCDRSAAYRWFKDWVKRERGEWQANSMWGSINHQLCRTLGYVAASVVLGWPEGDMNTIESQAFCRDRAMAVLTGRGWVYKGSNRGLDGKVRSSAGNSGELRGSRHYGIRNYDYLLSALMLPKQTRDEAYKQLDIAVLFLHNSGGIRADGIWDECKLPFVRSKSDECWNPRGTMRNICGTGPIDIGCMAERIFDDVEIIRICEGLGLVHHPCATFTVSFLAFGTPWHPELTTSFQIHHQHYYAMYFVDEWRPLDKLQRNRSVPRLGVPPQVRTVDEENLLADEWAVYVYMDTYRQE